MVDFAPQMQDQAGPLADVGLAHAPPVVLVVEDDPDVADVLELALTDAFEVATVVVHDGAVALKRAMDLRPAVILLDLMLPGLTGDAVARALRADPEARGSVIVGMSAVRDGSAFDGLCDAFVRKPFTLERLVHTLEPYLGGDGRCPGNQRPVALGVAGPEAVRTAI